MPLDSLRPWDVYRGRKLLVIKATADDPELGARLEGLLALADRDGEVAFAYSVKEAVTRFYGTEDPEQAADLLRDIIDVSSKRSAPFEVRRLARTLHNWFDPIVAWHEAKVSNGPTEGMNNLLKRVKRVAFGFTNFENSASGRKGDLGPVAGKGSGPRSPG